MGKTGGSLAYMIFEPPAGHIQRWTDVENVWILSLLQMRNAIL